MSDNDLAIERLVELVEQNGVNLTEVKRAIVENDDSADLLELAEDLWEVLEEASDVLETIDFEEVSDTIDLDELEENVDVEDIPEGLFDENETAIDLSDLQEAVNLRELWDAVDLTELREEKQELDEAVDDVNDDLNNDDSGDDDDTMFENVIDTEGTNIQFDAETRQAYLEDKVQTAIEEFRSVLLSTHKKLHQLYRMNQEKLGQPGRQSDSLNPTAYSSLPPGPIPDSVSTRRSTVPAQVKYSKVENLRRIYGRRFTKAKKNPNSEENKVNEDNES